MANVSLRYTPIHHDGDDIAFVALKDLPIDTQEDKITFLATAMFAPVCSAVDLTTAAVEDPWYCPPQKLWAALKPFPMLRMAFRDLGREVEGSEGSSWSEIEEPECGSSVTSSDCLKCDFSLTERVHIENVKRWRLLVPVGKTTPEPRGGSSAADQRSCTGGEKTNLPSTSWGEKVSCQRADDVYPPVASSPLWSADGAPGDESSSSMVSPFTSSGSPDGFTGKLSFSAAVGSEHLVGNLEHSYFDHSESLSLPTVSESIGTHTTLLSPGEQLMIQNTTAGRGGQHQDVSAISEVNKPTQSTSSGNQISSTVVGGSHTAFLNQNGAGGVINDANRANLVEEWPLPQKSLCFTIVGLDEPEAVEDPRDLHTFQKDVKLLDLLSDVASFDVHAALKPLTCVKELAQWSPLQKLPPVPELFKDMESSTAPPLLLDEAYYLAQGRPLMALHLRESRPSLGLPLISDQDLIKLSKSVALHNLLDQGVVSSAVCLLELCSLDTEMLRVDVQAAKRIYEYLETKSEQEQDPLPLPNSVIDLFLSFENTPSAEAMNSPALLTSLRMLEEATWALDPNPSKKAQQVQSGSAGAASSGPVYDSPWHLVALFCRVHALPRSLTLLHELARNNDWVMFLHEADLQECPDETVLDIVDGYFTDIPLQSHLRILVSRCVMGALLGKLGAGAGGGGVARAAVLGGADHSLGTSKLLNKNLVLGDHDVEKKAGTNSSAAKKSGEAKKAGGDTRNRNPNAPARQAELPGALGFLLANLDRVEIPDHAAADQHAHGSVDNHVVEGQNMGLHLLMHAVHTATARLAVVASCFPDVDIMNCMAVWLHVSVSEVAAERTAAPSPWLWGEEDLLSQLLALCKKSASRCFWSVLRCLRIFDPDTPLVDFVRFNQAFVQARFEKSKEFLTSFVQKTLTLEEEEEHLQNVCGVVMCEQGAGRSEGTLGIVTGRMRSSASGGFRVRRSCPHYDLDWWGRREVEEDLAGGRGRCQRVLGRGVGVRGHSEFHSHGAIPRRYSPRRGVAGTSNSTSRKNCRRKLP